MKTDVAVRFERILTAREKRELQGAVFRNGEMIGVDLSGGDFRGARFERMVLMGCTLAGADLRGVHFILCDLRHVVLDHAMLGDNRFYGTTLIEIAGLSEDDRLLVERNGGVFQHPLASQR